MTSTYSQQSSALSPSFSSSASPNFDVLTVPGPGNVSNNLVTGLSTITHASTVPFSGGGLSGLSSSASSSQNQSWIVQLTLSQLLYDGGATIASRRAARINEEQAYYQLRDTIDTVVQTVITQFYQILLNKALVQVQEESVNLLQSQLEDQKSRYEAGTVPAI